MPLPSLALRAAAFLAILACWLMAHPYEGIRHDGILYLGQVLLHSTAPALSQDVFFSGGSQDRFSIYSHLLVPLYAYFGRLPTHVGVLTLNALGLLTAVWALLRHVDTRWEAKAWGLLTLAVMSPIYAGSWVFSYGEVFVTARSFAEPLLMWCVVALLARHWLVAGALLLLAMAFHPLMALPVLVMGWIYLALADRRWLWLLAAVPLVLGAALAGLPVVDGLIKTFDPYWWAVFEVDNRHLRILNWSRVDVSSLALDLAVLLAAARLHGPGLWARWLQATVIATAGLIALSFALVDGLHVVLITQLQLWRAHWVSHLLAMTLAPWLLASLWQRGNLWRVSACALALALLNTHIGMSHDLATLILWGVTSLAAWRVRQVSPPIIHVACGAILLCAIGLSAYQLATVLEQMSWEVPDAGWGVAFTKVAGFPTFAVAGFAGLLALARRRASGAALALVLSVCLFATASVNWDQRTDLARAIEAPPASLAPFAAQIAATESVYWPAPLLPSWGLLGRISHYSGVQGAGVVFNRDTALIYGPRKETYRLIKKQQEQCNVGARMSQDRAMLALCPMPSRDQLVTLCGQTDAPDVLILPEKIRALTPLASWSLPEHRDVPQTFHLYRCAQLTVADS